MRKLPTVGTLILTFFLVAITAAAVQQTGRVVNRDGAAQPKCQVIFSGATSYTVYTNSAGQFRIDNAVKGKYKVTVKQGRREQTFKNVEIDESGSTPLTLVIDW